MAKGGKSAGRKTAAGKTVKAKGAASQFQSAKPARPGAPESKRDYAPPVQSRSARPGGSARGK
jgi:hypothetical protein